jgi:hypothetical protein
MLCVLGRGTFGKVVLKLRLVETTCHIRIGCINH